MTVRSITGIKYYTVNDVAWPEVRQYLQEDSSLRALAQAGYSMAEYLSTITIDPEMHSGLQDIMVVCSVMQTKALEVRLLTAQLKNALNIQLEQEDNK